MFSPVERSLTFTHVMIHETRNAKRKRLRFKKKSDCRVSSRQAMQRDKISTQFFPSGSLKCASQNDLLKPWSSQSTGKQIWCRPSAPENESPVTLDVSPLPGTSEAISLLQVDGGETLQTRISRAAFAVEWRHLLTVRYYVKTCEGMWKICEDMKVLVRICGRKRQLLCLFHESRHNRSSDHNFRREFLRWWYWLTASWRHPLRVQRCKVVWLLAIRIHTRITCAWMARNFWA